MGTSGIFKKPNRKNWYLRVYCTRRRKQFRESAHTSDEDVARQRLAEAERLVTLGAYVPPGERRIIEARENLSVHTAVAEFIGNMATDRASKSYVDTTSYLLFNFLEFFEEVDLRGGRHFAPEELPKCRLRRARYKKTPKNEMLRLLEPLPGDRPARLITTPIVQAYKAHRLDVADADETTVNNELKILRMFGRWLTKRAGLSEDPFEAVKDVTDDGAPAGRSLTSAEFGAIVSAAHDDLMRWLLVVGLHGLRKGEANHLRPEDINVEGGYLDIRIHRDRKGKVIWKPKFGIERKVPFVEATVPLMKALREMPVDKHGRIFGVHDRRKALAKVVAAAEVAGHVRFHDFRHTAYTKLKEALLDRYDATLTLGDVQKIFGHKVQGMDRVYDHRTVERLRKVMGLMPLVPAVAHWFTGEGGLIPG